MLIDDEIKQLCEQGSLFCVEPLDWRGNRERAVYVSRDLYQFLVQPSVASAINDERRRLQRLFDRFILGAEITVAFKRNIKSSDMKRLWPPRQEVWEFKVRGRAKQQLRSFGRFAQTDVFVALTGPVDRQHCDYNAEIVRCQQEWGTLLPGRSPIHGSTIDDYISAKRISLGDY
jgi:hypothetical protein